MPDDNTEFRLQWTNDRAQTFRLSIYPPSTDPLDSPTVVSIPPSFLSDLGSLSYKYDKWPVGLPETPVLTLKPDLAELQSSAELQYLREVITGQHNTSTNVYRTDPATGLLGALSLLPVWTLYWDFGGARGTNPDHSSGLWPLFVGVQRFLPTAKGEVENATEASSRLIVSQELQIVDAVRYCLESATSDMVARAALLYLGEDGSPTYYSQLFDVLYESGGVVYFVAQGRPSDLVADSVRLLSTAELAIETNALLRKLWWRVLRIHPDDQATDSLEVVSATNTDGDASPEDALIYHHKQDTTDETADRGSVTFGSRYFAAYMFPSNLTDDPDNYVGGWLVDDGSGTSQNSIYRLPNLWDVVGTWADSILCKVCLRLEGRHTVGRVHYLGMKQDPLAGSRSLVAVDFAPGEPISFEERSGFVVGADAQFPGMSATDFSETHVEASRKGLQSEERSSVRSFFHNVPRQGPGGRGGWKYGTTGGLFTKYPPDLYVDALTYRGVYTEQVNAWNLWYLENPAYSGGGNFFTDSVPIRFHSEVSIEDGDLGGVYHGDRFPWPTYTTGKANPVEEGWWDEMSAAIRFTQRDSCLPFASAEVYSTSLALFRMCEWRGRLKCPTDVGPDDVGRPFSLFGGDASGLNGGGETWLSYLPTDRALVTSWTLALKDGEVSVSFLHLPEP